MENEFGGLSLHTLQKLHGKRDKWHQMKMEPKPGKCNKLNNLLDLMRTVHSNLRENRAR